MNTLRWNVIEEKEYKEIMSQVFKSVANSLSKTFGPFGSTTILEDRGQTRLTKDGWTVLKKYRYDDHVANIILDILVNICSQVVVKVGDGSTTAMISSDKLFEEIENSGLLKSMRRKEFLEELDVCVNRITEEILKISNKITQENIEEIYNVAYVSTNREDAIAKIIEEIYTKLENPTIGLVKGIGLETRYEIEEGYNLQCRFLDRIYMNTDGTCEVKNPLLLVFNHKIDYETYMEKIIRPAENHAFSQGRKLVIIAPYYDNFMIEQIEREVTAIRRANSEFRTIYCNATVVSNSSRVDLNDFAAFAGCEVLKENTPYLLEEKDGEEEFILTNYIGEVEHISIGDTYTTIKGFVKQDKSLYELLINDAKDNVQKAYTKAVESNVVGLDLFEAKKRLSKLQGNMATIYVGGKTPMETQANYDLIEDAVKACESAFKFGYNIGGSNIIPIAINHILSETKEGDISKNRKDIYTFIDNAFKNVFRVVLKNKYDLESDEEKINTIINNCIDNEVMYDLVKDDYTKEVINPSYTDIEILKATTSIIGLLLSSNQYVSAKLNTNDTVNM